MNISLPFIRAIFVCLCVLFFTTYAMAFAFTKYDSVNLAGGIITGLGFGLLLTSMDSLFKRLNLRAFNTAILGLLVGYLMGEAVSIIFKTLIEISALPLKENVIGTIHIFLFLTSIYLGMVMTVRGSEELSLSIPFIKLKPTNQKKKDILIDPSLLSDSRIIDLAASGLLDNHLVLARFTLKELYEVAESGEDNPKSKARRSLEVVKKLENIPSLDLRYNDTDFPEIKDSMSKLVRLARLLDANIITADNNRVQQSAIEGIRIINIHTLSNALKPITQTGEYLTIKIQRYGKEPRQGVGYLEDGTMVVVNGGAEFIGETLRAQVLSLKHTSSGRMIFCNVAEDLFNDIETSCSTTSLEQEIANKNMRLYEMI